MIEAIIILALLAAGAFVFFRASSKGAKLIDQVAEQPIAVVNEKKASKEQVEEVKAASKKRVSKPKAKKS